MSSQTQLSKSWSERGNGILDHDVVVVHREIEPWDETRLEDHANGSVVLPVPTTPGLNISPRFGARMSSERVQRKRTSDPAQVENGSPLRFTPAWYCRIVMLDQPVSEI
jgi:hypothetical protein